MMKKETYTMERSLSKLKNIVKIIQKDYSTVISVIGTLTFIVGAIIQFSYLAQYNGGLNFFSISQTVIDVLRLTSYLLIFLVIPLLVAVFSTGKLDKYVNRKEHILVRYIFVFCVGLYFLYAIGLMFSVLNKDPGGNLYANIVIFMILITLIYIPINGYSYFLKINTNITQGYGSTLRKERKNLCSLFFIIIVISILLYHQSFALLGVNIAANGLLLILLASWFISLFDIPEKKNTKSNDSDSSGILLGIGIFNIAFFIGAFVAYILNLGIYIYEDFNNFGSLVIENNIEKIDYKNDKYIFLSGNDNIKVIGLDKVDYYISNHKTFENTFYKIEKNFYLHSLK